ncbi:MAG: ribonuclease HI [Bacteroidales bacterium]|nr:ribonuclease HI [Bacteroidales bacterium]
MEEDIQLKRFFFKITDFQAQEYRILIRAEASGEESYLGYLPLTKSLVFLENDSFSGYLKTHEHQLRKMLHNKRLDTFYIGFEMHFILWENKDMKQFSDRSKIIVLDCRTLQRKIYTFKKEEKEITKVYTDGSFLEKKGKGGYVVLIKKPTRNYQLHTYDSSKKSSSLIELEAAIKSLEILKDIEKIRIVSDSQYVRKGLTEWVPIWELNDWHTVNGEKVKNIGYWKYFNSLSKGKYIEFEWVKAHDNHFENTLCDLYAKMQAGSE